MKIQTDSPAEVSPFVLEFYPFGFGLFANVVQALDFTLDVVTDLSIDEI